MSQQPTTNPIYDTTRAFSACDIIATIQPQPAYGILKPMLLGTLAMLSVSSHRDKFPVTSCSRIGPKGFTAGHRLIGGTLAFNTIDREAFTKITDNARKMWKTPDVVLADEFPGFDVIITFVNEIGNASYSTIEGITILDEGITYSLDNIALMESYSYMAISRTPLQPAYITSKNSNDGSEYVSRESNYTEDDNAFSKTQYDTSTVFDDTLLHINQTGIHIVGPTF